MEDPGISGESGRIRVLESRHGRGTPRDFRGMADRAMGRFLVPGIQNPLGLYDTPLALGA
jgi:hypothetical protein